MSMTRCLALMGVLVLTGVPAVATPAAEAEVAVVAADCGAVEQSAMGQSADIVASLLGASSDPSAAQPLASLDGMCRREGKGALAYCIGNCPKVNTTCTEVILSTGFTCACKARTL